LPVTAGARCRGGASLHIASPSGALPVQGAPEVDKPRSPPVLSCCNAFAGAQARPRWASWAQLTKPDLTQIPPPGPPPLPVQAIQACGANRVAHGASGQGGECSAAYAARQTRQRQRQRQTRHQQAACCCATHSGLLLQVVALALKNRWRQWRDKRAGSAPPDVTYESLDAGSLHGCGPPPPPPPFPNHMPPLHQPTPSPPPTSPTSRNLQNPTRQTPPPPTHNPGHQLLHNVLLLCSAAALAPPHGTPRLSCLHSAPPLQARGVPEPSRRRHRYQGYSRYTVLERQGSMHQLPIPSKSYRWGRGAARQGHGSCVDLVLRRPSALLFVSCCAGALACLALV
jgi:hypothetical protein